MQTTPKALSPFNRFSIKTVSPEDKRSNRPVALRIFDKSTTEWANEFTYYSLPDAKVAYMDLVHRGGKPAAPAVPAEITKEQLIAMLAKLTA